MRQNATIVMHDGRLMAEVVRSEACQSCRACNFGQQERVYIDIGALNCAEGDRVYIDIEDGSVSLMSLVAYGIPAAMFFAGLLLGAAVTHRDYLQALCALIGLGAGLLAVKIIEKIMKRSGRYTPHVTVSRE